MKNWRWGRQLGLLLVLEGGLLIDSTSGSETFLEKGRTMQRGEIEAGGTWRGIIRLGKLRCI